MPARLGEIIDWLAQSNEPNRCQLASFLLDAAGDFRSVMAARINEALQENKLLGGARPWSVSRGMEMTLYVWSPPAPRERLAAEQHTRAVMLTAGETSRRLVELEYGDDGVLAAAHLKHLSLDALGPAELADARTAAFSLQRRRLKKRRLRAASLAETMHVHVAAGGNSSGVMVPARNRSSGQAATSGSQAAAAGRTRFAISARVRRRRGRTGFAGRARIAAGCRNSGRAGTPYRR